MGVAQVAEHLGDLAGWAADLGADEVACNFDLFVAHVDHARAVHLHGQQVHIAELVFGFGLHIFPQRARGGVGVVHHERQLKGFDARETSGRVAWHGPDDVDDTILGLVEELWRRATELHGGIAFELDAAA
jgi:hypothetical protein